MEGEKNLTLRFILGPAGSGKTEYCLRNIREELRDKPDGHSLIYLVPEQATFQLEKELACTPGLGGLMRVQVLSFRRLAWRVFREVGGENRKPIGELGKKMVLKRLLENRKGDLEIFAQAAKQPGFLDILSKTLSEMKTYLITPEQLKGSAAFFDMDEQKLLSAKLRDISILYRDFENYLLDKYLDPDDYLTSLAEKINLCSFVKGSEIWIDDFTGFTPQEYRVIEELTKAANHVNIALSLNPQNINKPLEDEDCFYITKETFTKINKLCEVLKVAVSESIILQETPNRFKESQTLAYLETNYFNADLSSYDQEVNNIEIASGVNRRAEIENIAREILQLSRLKGYRWREIAVILRDFEGYQELVETTFYDYGVPFFMDKKRSMIHHPLVELIISSMEIVHENWSIEPLFRSLKTDFFPLDRDAVDRLENYIIAHGIRGKAWFQQSPWGYRRTGTLGEDNELSYWEKNEIAYINKTKEMVQEVLIEFHHSLKIAKSVADKTIVMYKLIERLEVDKKLDVWIEEARIKGNLEEEREHSQIYQAVIQVLEELVETLGDEHITLEDYSQILRTGLEGIELGLIPPGLDQVVVGCLGRSRIPNIKAAFLAGVTDGVLPKRPSEEGMLIDRERESLKRLGMELAPGDERLLIDEDYLVYTGLTRASEYLCVSYPLADTEGRALMPSMLIDNIKRIFPNINEKLWILEPKSAEETLTFVCSGKGTLPIMVGQFRFLKEGMEIDSRWFDVYNWFINQEEYTQRISSLFQGLFWTNQEAPLFKQTREALFHSIKGDIKTSISRLEKFKQCPFAHFISYGLKLRRRLSNRLEAPDYGQFYHAALKDFFVKLDSGHMDMAELTQDKLITLLNEVVEDLAPQMQNELLLSSNRYKFLATRLQNIVESSLKAMIDHAKKGSARPIGHEIDFGYEGSILPPLEISVNGETVLQIAGRIDRVDSVVSENASYLLIIDYKSGNTQLKLDDLYHGLSLQLLAYLLACLENSGYLELDGALPGGICYFRVHNPIVKLDKTQDEDKIKKMLSKEYKLRGMVLAEEKFVRLMDSEFATGWSQVIPVGLTNDGFYQNSKVFTTEDFDLLKEHFYKTIKKIGQEILAGIVTIEPYKKGKIKPCIFCDFKAICQFDILFKENNYKVLDNIAHHTVWEKLKGTDRERVHTLNGGAKNE